MLKDWLDYLVAVYWLLQLVWKIFCSMLIQAYFLQQLILTANDESIITSTNFSWDEKALKFTVNTNTFPRNGMDGAILGGLQLLNFLSNASKLQTEDRNTSPEVAFGIYFSVCFLCWNAFYCFSMGHFGTEFKNYINSAYHFEQAYENRIKSQGKQKLITIVKFYVFLMRAGTKTAPFYLTFLAILMPSLPMNFLSFPPGQYIVTLFDLLGRQCQTCWMFYYFSFGLQVSLNLIAWIFLVKYGI